MTHVQDLSAAKRALLAKRFKAGKGLDTLAAFPRADVENGSALSFGQQRLWFLDQLEPGHTHHNIRKMLRLIGCFDIDAFRKSLQEIVRRHQILRTIFVLQDGAPVQKVVPSIELPVSVIDLQSIDDPEREHCLTDIVRQDAATGFDLSTGPLIRVTAMRLSTQEHVVIFTAHHIVYDAWSESILVRELGLLYEAFTRGSPSPLPELAAQYADFAQWQRQKLVGEHLQEQLQYWTARVAGAPPLLSLPLDHPRPPIQTYNGASITLPLPRKLHQGLDSVAREHNATLFMVLLAAFNVLLARYSGQQDICVGTPVAGRPNATTESLIGCFINMLVLRSSVPPGASFASYLSVVREQTLDAFDHDSLPFEQLVSALQGIRNTAYPPLFQAMFALLNAPSARPSMPGLTIEWVDPEKATTQYDITLFAEMVDGTLMLTFEYNTDLFERETIARISRQFVTLLGSIVADSNQEVGRLTSIDDSERELLLGTFNATARPYPRDVLVHQLFEDQARHIPQDIALIFEDTHLTFGALNSRANQLAHYLIGLGVKPDDLIAICMERSIEMVVAILAVLKAGAAYVPLEPDYPAQRLAYMLEDCAPAVLLTHTATEAKLDNHPIKIVVDRQQAAWSASSEKNPDPGDLGLTPNHLAYVIYTSGSTGHPKGAMNQHDGVVNQLLWAQQQFALTANDSVLQKTPFGFDVSVWEFFVPLLAGARLVMARPRGHQDPAYLSDIIEQQAISILHFVPSMLQIFLTYGRIGACRSVRHLLCIGEALTPALQELCLTRLPHVQLHNLYGPAEAAVDVTYWLCRHSPGQDTVPIGRPIANVQIYILDELQQPIPIGAVGELCIAGIQVGRGYLNKEALTAERFVPNPFSTQPGSRLYRTGDLARYRADGTIEYCGRNDFQIKLRGSRVELGEIEAVLTALSGVREAVVTAHDDGTQGKRLVAYLRFEAGQQTDMADLRHTLAATLPDYMIPSHFIALDSFPLSANGKLDRNALPEPDFLPAVAGYEPPRTAIETALAAVWSDVLKVDRVGIDDNFFELGGHSLLAIEAISKARDALDRHVTVQQLFDAQTIRRLAICLEGPAGEQERPETDPVMVIDRNGELALSLMQERIWFIHQFDPGNVAYNMPLALRLKGPLNIAAVQSALQWIVDRHEVFRCSFVDHGGEPLLHIAQTLTLQLFQASISDIPAHRREAEARRLIKDEAARPFDLSVAPLLRASLVRLGDAEHLLMLTIHHIICDGWSLETLGTELAEAYHAMCASTLPAKPPLAIQYVDFAAWQRRRLRGGDLQRQLDYWSQRLQGAPLRLKFLGHRTKSPRAHQRSVSYVFNLPRATIDALHALRLRTSSTHFMVLLAALNVLLSRYCGEDDICVGTPITTRTETSLEGLVGLFLNTLPLRSIVDETVCFETFVEQVRQTALDAFAHKEVPLEQLLNRLRPNRDQGLSSIFQVLFVYQNGRPRAPVPELGLEIDFVSAPPAQAKFDLSLLVTEVDGNVHCALEGAADLFDESAIRRMGVHFLNLLGGLTASPDQPMATVPMIGEGEQRQMLQLAAEPIIERPCGMLVHHLFENQAALTPTAVALSFSGRELTYSELNDLSNAIAHALMASGIKADDRVVILARAGFDLIAGMLAVLKSGGAFLVLDPALPRSRLEYMLADSGPQALLVQTTLRDLLREQSAPVIEFDSEFWLADSTSQRRGNPSPEAILASNLAYASYTSGSTGLPKAVLVEHRNVVNFVLSHIERYGIDRHDRVLQFASAGFDGAIEEIFPTLATGATLVLRPENTNAPGAEFFRYVADQKITVLDLPTAFWHAWVERLGETSGDCCATIRLIIVGGEEAKASCMERWVSHPNAPRCTWSNTYGPTETTVVATSMSLEPGGPAPPGCVPIGRPIANTRIYLLDRQARPVPLGLAGEIYIAGDGVARGYLNRQSLTSERFVTIPLLPGERLYRTGDIGRRRDDGQIEFLGRNDNQLKIRGYRVEPNEIEAALLRNPSIVSVVVLAREHVPSHQRLVAYYTTRDHEEVAAEQLRAYVADSLPDYMVPAAYMHLQELPKNVNGKIDRSALPEPKEYTYDRPAYEAPAGPIESAIAEIWSDMLAVDNVGRHDNFFLLGGHSLLAIKILDRMRRANLHASVRDLFASPSLSRLAAQIRSEPAETPRMPVTQAAAETRMMPGRISLPYLSQDQTAQIARSIKADISNLRDIYPLTPLQEGLLFHHLFDFNSDPYVLWTELSFATRASLDRYVGAINNVIARHDALRTAFAWHGLARPVQVVLREASVRVHEVEVQDGQDAASLLRELYHPARHRLNIGLAPPFALFAAYDVPNRRWILMQLVHHIIIDHASLELIEAEIYTLLNGESDKLLPPVPFRDFVSRASGRERDREHEKFFSGMLNDVKRPTTPFGLTDCFGDGTGIKQFQAGLPAQLARRLRLQAKRSKVSTATLFHVAWGMVLRAASDEADPVFGTFLFGRMQASSDADRAVGLLMNTLPVRVRFSALTARQSIAHTQKLLAELSDHEDASLAFAQRCSDVPAPAPLFTSLLNYRYTTAFKSEMVQSALPGVRGLGLEERSSYPLVMTVDDLGDGIELIAYALDPIKPDGLFASMKAALELLVRAVEQDPDEPLPVLERAEVEQLCRAADSERRALRSSARDGLRSDRLSNAIFDHPTESARLPQNLEDTLVSLFGEILEVEQMNPDQCFFAAGGNSLDALHLAMRIHAELGIMIAIRLIFENPTPAELAQKLTKEAEQLLPQS